MAKIGNLMTFNPKIILVNFVRRYYNPKLDYAGTLIKDWNTSLVTFVIDVLYNGFVTYLALTGLLLIFPQTNQWIYLGDKFWHFPYIIILLGILTWFVKGTYKWFRVDYKKGV